MPQYYVEGCHEPIIPRELYMRVQEEMARRARLQTGTGKRRIYSGKYALSSRVYCGHCGDLYQRTHWNIHGRKEIVWRCVNRIHKTKSGIDCPARTVKESDLHAVVIQAVNELIEVRDQLLPWVRRAIERGLRERNTDQIAEIEERLKVLQQELLKKSEAHVKAHGDALADLHSDSHQDYQELTITIDTLQDEKQRLLLKDAEDQGIQKRMQEIMAFLEEQETGITDYDEGMVRMLIEKIMVYDDRCDVEFKSGIVREVYV